jgi:hypothetical protein
MLLPALFLFAWGGAANAQASAPVAVPQVAGPEALLAEGAVPQETLAYETSPGRNVPARWVTTVKLAHTATQLLAHVEAFDPAIDRLVAQQSKYDAVSTTDDAIVLYVVSKQGSRRAFVFRVNAAGARADSIQSSGGDSAPDWNGQWQSAAKVLADRYVVDFAIPFATLGLDRAGGDVPIRIDVERQVGRDRMETLSLVPMDEFRPCPECQFSARTIGFDAEAAKASVDGAELRLQPYVIATRAARFPAAGADTISNEVDAGLDVTWKPDPHDTVVATLNPDFSQVEIDSIQFQVNKRFVRTFPERRQFFTNESGIFSTILPLLYTRSMVDPSVGLQYVRRQDDYEIGALWVADQATSYILPGEEGSSIVGLDAPSRNFAGRVNYRPSADWRLGATVTSRTSDDYRSAVGAVDAGWAIDASNQLEVQLAHSSACDPATIATGERCNDGNAYKLTHAFGGDEWYSYAEYGRYDRWFRADMGLMQQVGIRDLFESAGYKRTFGKGTHALLQGFSVDGTYTRQDSIETGLLYQSATIGGSLDSERADLQLQGRGTEEVAYGERFREAGATLTWTHHPWRTFSYGASVDVGDAVDYVDLRLGTQRIVTANATYKPASRFEARASVSQVAFDLEDGPLFRTRTAALRAEYHFNTVHHLQALLNLGSVETWDGGVRQRDWTSTWQVTYQYRPTPFRYLIVGVSGAGAAEDRLSRTRLQSSFAFAKYVFDLNW